MKTTRDTLKSIMNLAWQFVKRNGLNIADALRLAWANIKLNGAMRLGIVAFTFRKVDGSLRQAYGTLRSDLCAPVVGAGRRANDTLQVYFDTEKCEYRCFKKINLVSTL